MKEDLWKQTIVDGKVPRWPCPACTEGHLVLIKDSFVKVETQESLALHIEFEWEAERTTYTFTCWLTCSACGEQVALTGDGGLQPSWNEYGQDLEQYFQPRHAWPMPDVFPISESCDKDVAKLLRASFRLVWSDRESAVNRLRAALERLLTSLDIKERRRGVGRIIDLTLHDRIGLLAAMNPKVASNLMGVKWVGNTGSHSGPVSLDDLLATYNIVEHALEELVEQRAMKMAVLAAQLTAKHRKPRRRKRATAKHA